MLIVRYLSITYDVYVIHALFLPLWRMLLWHRWVRRCYQSVQTFHVYYYQIKYGFSCNLEKHTHCTRPSGTCYLDRLWKTHSCMFFPNCTRNRIITNTNTVCLGALMFIFVCIFWYYIIYRSKLARKSWSGGRNPP